MSASSSSSSASVAKSVASAASVKLLVPGRAAEDLPTIPATLIDLAAYEGTEISGVHAILRGSLWTTPPQLKGPASGSKFRFDDARAELDRLLATGLFASGTIEVEPRAAGLALTYRLTPARLVKQIVVHDSPIADDDIRRAAKLSEARDVTEESIARAKKDLALYLAQRGYPSGRAELVPVETDDARLIVLDVRIVAGDPTVIDRRIFEGLPTWDDDAVVAAERYHVRASDRADEDELQSADRAFAGALRGAGFWTAVVTHDVVPEHDDPLHSRLVINVTTGAKMIVDFDGNHAFDDGQLTVALGLKTEEDRSASGLSAKIEEFYQRHGFLDARVNAELLGAVTDRTRTLRFEVREDERVRVTGRVYPCLTGALDAARLNAEVDSFLDEDIGTTAFSEISERAASASLMTNGDVSEGTRLQPMTLDPKQIFVADTYVRAVEHLRDLYKSEGYIFAEIAEATLIRGTCVKGGMPGAEACHAPPPRVPTDAEICRVGLDGLPKESAPIPRDRTCTTDSAHAISCAATAQVVIPIQPGPRSFLWDVAFEGTAAIAPSILGAVAYGDLNVGGPLSLKDVESARRHVLEKYHDEGYAFAAVRASIDYSPDKSRARVRLLVSEGERVEIEAIVLEGNTHTRSTLLRERLTIKAGDIYRASEVRASQERLQTLGVFSSVSIGLISPTVPSRRKVVQVSVVERKPYSVDTSGGYATGEGVRAQTTVSIQNLWGYATSLDLQARLSYQPFLGGPSLYNTDVYNRWTQLATLDRFPLLLSAVLTLPHSPIFGTPVRTTFEFVDLVDLKAAYRLSKLSPTLTMTYVPARWFTLGVAVDVERNNLFEFDAVAFEQLLQSGASSIHLFSGKTSIAAGRANLTLDWRDSRFNATKNGFLTLGAEYVKSIQSLSDGASPPQDFLHLTGGGGMYFKLGEGRATVLAIEIQGGANVDILSCAGNPVSHSADPDKGIVNQQLCESYPDRRFYLGGISNYRGFSIAGQMLPQDIVDQVAFDIRSGARSNASALVAASAFSGADYYLNARVELRVPAFSFGGVVFFVDAANGWIDPKAINPLELRLAVGTGFSLDTPIGPFAIDFGFNLAPDMYHQYADAGETKCQPSLSWTTCAPAVTLALGRF